MISFLRRQTRDIREGGLPVLLRKAGTLLMMPLALPVALVVRALSPLWVIRFGQLPSSRIGHFAANIELYLCERDVGIQSQRTFDVFYHTPPICNHQLRKMVDRTLRVSRLARPLDRLNRWLPGGEKHVIPMSSSWDFHGLLARTQVHLSLTPEEESLGHVALQRLGIPERTPFVCFHARDSIYLNNVIPNMDWRYHDYRDSTIHNYVHAAEELVRRGYFAVRMGVMVKEALTIANPMIVDYGFNGRTDFLDIYLGARCQFFICDTAGISSIPTIFRRPVAWVNYVPLELAPTWSASDLFIPKKLWLREERRFLTFLEILDSRIGRFRRTEEYEQLGVEVIENTSEEITGLVVEMDERLKETWQMSEEDEELQRRFWSLFKRSELNRTFLSRIGAEFLRQNRELLD